MVGLQVVVVKCDAMGNVDLDDLRSQVRAAPRRPGRVMITYPSTYGIFEPRVKELCAIVHEHGGRVYVDGANMNALVGAGRARRVRRRREPPEPAQDLLHPARRRRPGVGPVCVVKDLVPFLPAAPCSGTAGAGRPGVGRAAGQRRRAADQWMYVRMMGAEGLQRPPRARSCANYMRHGWTTTTTSTSAATSPASREEAWRTSAFSICAPLKDSSGISAEDVAKRLINYGFHAPT